MQSPEIEVVDFPAVRLEHRGNDDGALIEPERARLTNTNEGSPPSSSEPALTISTAALPRTLKNERFFRSSSRKSPSARLQKWPYGVFSGDGLGLVCLRELGEHTKLIFGPIPTQKFPGKFLGVPCTGN